MRILLTMQQDCTSYDSIRTINRIRYRTFQEACYAIGLLSDNKEFVEAIKEASELASGHQLRKLFVMLLVSNTISKPEFVWNQTWELLSDGILYERRRTLRSPGKLSLITSHLKYLSFFFKRIKYI